jgi:RimJ/RimL family protein N-acetyltransferase
MDLSPRSAIGEFRIRASLRDGTPVCVRAIKSDDKGAFERGFRRLSPRTIQRRFFSAVSALTPQDLRYFTELDFTSHVGLVITIEQAATEILIAVGRFVRLSSNPEDAEVAFIVADEYQHRGAATLLLRHLTPIARTLGIRRFVAFVQHDNRDMLRVFEQTGCPLTQTFENGATRVTLNIEPSREQL